jgi:hypothetical protein
MELVDEAGGRKPLFANGSYTADLEIGI